MKADILKIAGVKSEKEFYKLFPDEQSFMAKHGGEFKKAQQGTSIPTKTKPGFQADGITPIEYYATKKILLI